MSTTKSLIESTTKADDLNDLLHHIAWEELILPELTKHRDILTTQLVDKTLGRGQTTPYTVEQLAGHIHGIDFIKRLLTRIIEKGEKATTILREQSLT
jgi:hypothetical protein